MNKSLEYIKNRIINNPNSVSKMPVDGWDDALIINPMDKYLYYIPTLKDCFISDNEFSVRLSEDRGEFGINIEYNPDAAFEYFTMENSTHDGTLLFVEEVIQKLLYKLLQFGTVPKRITEDIVGNPTDFNYKYIIGDIVMHRDFGLKSINGHQWDGETDIVVLPIKFEYNLK